LTIMDGMDQMINMLFALVEQLKNFRKSVKGQSHEKVCEIFIWDVSFGINQGPPIESVILFIWYKILKIFESYY
jgi:hypothetical protein